MNNRARLGPRFSAAIAFASEIHGNQLRKGTRIPYVGHLLAVTALVIEEGGGEDVAIAALLHDAIEDQGGRDTLDRIRARFGEKVANIVVACTDADVTPKPPWRQRKEAYLASIPHNTRHGRMNLDRIDPIPFGVGARRAITRGPGRASLPGTSARFGWDPSTAETGW